jgi:hypothetical protein
MNVNREQMAAFLVRSITEEPPLDYCGGVPPPAPPFSDVSPETWSCRYIKRLSELQITKGCGDGTTYCPLSEVIRDQMAAFLGRGFLGMQ